MKSNARGNSARKNKLSTAPALEVAIGLICLGVAASFSTLALGFVNIAPQPGPALQARALPPPEPDSPPAQAPQTGGEPTEKQRKELENMASKLAEESREVERVKRKLALDRATLLKSRNTLAAVEKQLLDGVRQAGEKANAVKGEAEQQRAVGAVNVDARLAEDRRQIVEADRKADELRRQIREKKTLFDPERLFAGREAGEKPQWVECTKGAVILVPQGEKISVDGLKTARAFTEAVAGRYVVFLVRPDGFGAFASARAAAEESGAKRLGYEPIDRNWQMKYR